MAKKSDRKARGFKGSESLRGVETALADLFMDSEERPVMKRETAEVRRLVSMHLGEIRGTAFDNAQAAIDQGLKEEAAGVVDDPIERLVVPATERLGAIYLALRKAMLGE